MHLDSHILLPTFQSHYNPQSRTMKSMIKNYLLLSNHSNTSATISRETFTKLRSSQTTQISSILLLSKLLHVANRGGHSSLPHSTTSSSLNQANLTKLGDRGLVHNFQGRPGLPFALFQGAWHWCGKARIF